MKKSMITKLVGWSWALCASASIALWCSPLFKGEPELGAIFFGTSLFFALVWIVRVAK